MGWSESQLLVCRKHPFENPQPGICPSCLRQRLATIADDHNNYHTMSSRTFYYSDNSSSDGFRSPSRTRRHQRVASDVLASISMALGGGGGLNKSRSVVNYGPRKAGRSDDLKRKKKHGGGFWNKLRLLSFGGNRGGS